MALFGEKYGAEVRVLEMGNFSLELCGGTHVSNTKDIGLFSITNETSLASGVRRIEALSSSGAFEYLQTRSLTLQKIEKLFSTEAKKLSGAVTDLQSDVKSKNKEIKKLQDQLQSIQAKDMFNDIEKLSNGTGLLSLFVKDTSPKDFRSLSDKFIDQNKEDVLFIYTIDGDKISYLLRTDRKNKKIHCSNTLKACQEIVSGRGGGKPDMAQGSGLAAAADEFVTKIKEQLSL
jgi:alanyl-tRNA synthetase